MSILNRLIICLSTVLGSSCLAEIYDIYSYHTDPPFSLQSQQADLSRAWVKRFNQQHSDVQLNLKLIKRPDLNSFIEKEKPYLILWANPIWFRSRDAKVKASNPIFWDSDIWISHNNYQVNYFQPEDLIKRTMGGRSGYFYKGIKPLVDAGKITRINQDTDYANYEMLLKGKIEVFVMSRSSFLYWQSTDMQTDMLYSAMSAHDAYTRHVLAGQGYQHLLPALNHFIQTIKTDKQWQTLLKNWGIANLVSPFDIELDELDSIQVD